MRYVTHYEEYPIYEPAEGGYYYSGNQVINSEKLSKRKAKETLKRIWEEAKLENLRKYGETEPMRDRDNYGNRIYPWRISRDGNMVWRSSRYIGEGESYLIEKHVGSETRGYHPYC